MFTSFFKTETEKAPEFRIISVVKLSLWHEIASCGGSEVTWKTVLAMYPDFLLLWDAATR
jgi:hypothetical protein